MPKKSHTWFHFRASSGDSGDVSIFSDIGGWGVTAQDFNNQLRALGKVSELRISISSNGGDVATGFAIYNMLNRHPATKIVTIEGLAASMASVIAMAGDTVKMPSNAMLMIHNPWGAVSGKSEEIASFANALKIMGANIAKAYKDRTGLGLAKIREMMNAETWLSAADAVAQGFADSIEKPANARASFDVSRFSRVPASFGRYIVKGKAMTTKNAAAETEFEGDDTDTRESVRQEILAHNEDVKALCAIAGVPELADGFITEGKTQKEVVAAIQAAKADKAKGKGGAKDAASAVADVSARNNPRNQGATQATIDPSSIWAKWNRQNVNQ